MATIIHEGNDTWLRIYITPDNMEEVNEYFPDFLFEQATLVGDEPPVTLRDAKLYWGACSWNNYQDTYEQKYHSYGYFPGDSPTIQNELIRVDNDNPRYAIFLRSADMDDDKPYIDIACDTYGEPLQDLGTDSSNASSSIRCRLQFTIDNDAYQQSGATNVTIDLLNYKKAGASDVDWHNLVRDSAIQTTGVESQGDIIISSQGNSLACDTVIFKSDIPVFLNYQAAKAYIEDGTIDPATCFNYDTALTGNPNKSYLIHSTTYEYDKYKEKIGQDNGGHILFIKAGKAYIKGWIKEGGRYNCRLKAYGDDEELQIYGYDEGTFFSETMTIADFNSSRYATNFNTWPEFKRYGRNKYVRGLAFRKNIPFYVDESTADEAMEDDTIPTMEDDIFEEMDHLDLGTDVDTESDLTDKTFDACTGFITLYESTAAALNQLGSTIFDSTNWNDLQDALKIYGESPINSIIKCYHCPIDISAFITTEAATGFKVGSYNVTTTGVNKVQKYGKIKEIGSTIIAPTYGDFRDYQNFTYELHLPFSNPIALDPDEIMNKSLSIKATVDPVNLQLRYYIIVSSVVYKIVDASFGRQVALMGNDFAGKAREVRQDMFNLAGSAINIATGVMQPNPFAIAQGISQGAQSLIGTLEDTKKEPKKQMVGSFAPGCGECDLLYPYLVITETLSIKPPALEANYGRPTNLVTNLGQVHGFTCAELARIEVNCTDQEKQEIEQLVSSGIII